MPAPHAVVTLSGREIELKEPTTGQTAQLGRTVAAAQRVGLTGEGAVTAIARALDVLMALIAADEDRQFVDDGLTSGEIDVDDMKVILEAFTGDGDEAPKNGPAPKKRTRAQR